MLAAELSFVLACMAVYVEAQVGGGTGGMAKPSCVNGADFVITPTGGKRVDQLTRGDLIAVDRDKFEEVINFLHLDHTGSAGGYQFTTVHGTNVTLSDQHLTFIGPDQTAVLAKNVKIGDTLYVIKGDDRIEDKITRIDRKILTGLYSPLTPSGRILVNNILISCYSQYQDHHLLHKVFNWLMPIFGRDRPMFNKDGVHWVGDVIWRVFGYSFIDSHPDQS